jgi:hypothetical protein
MFGKLICHDIKRKYELFSTQERAIFEPLCDRKLGVGEVPERVFACTKCL